MSRYFALALVAAAAGLIAEPVAADVNAARITMLYDAFGKPSAFRKDWGFSAFIEYGGKRILFDTGNDAGIFAHNAEVAGVDLTDLDLAIISHRHGDHSSGLNHLLAMNPRVPVYTPKENFGVFGAALPGSFYERDESLPPEMRYFDGHAPETFHFGSPWEKGHFIRVTETTEIAPGFHLLLLEGSWGVDLDVMELALAIDTPDGIVLVVGCSHPTLERVVAAAKSVIDKPVHLIVGGTHLFPADRAETGRIATALRDDWSVAWLAPAHCTGEHAFAALQRAFGERYLYAGVGTSLQLGTEVVASAVPDARARTERRRPKYNELELDHAN